MDRKCFKFVLWLSLVFLLVWSPSASATLNTNAPTSPVKLIFIHHSTGENWLADSDGDLGIALRDNNYFVSDTNYGWGPDVIGDNTDIGHWWYWFRGANSNTYLQALYNESDRSWEFYSRLSSDPGGDNEIVMFKSCFPNSYLGGNPNDSATTGNNPLRGQDAWSEHMTVGNAKGIYNDILTYFATRQDKLFIVITAPPQVENDTDASHAANARAFNNWLVNDWLDNYSYNNVAVFDFYNVLTSNGGNSSINDLSEETGNHHRYWNGVIQHIQTVNSNTAAYPTNNWDSHPTAAGNQKATGEFVDLLNIYYNLWKGTGNGTSNPSSIQITGITTNLTSGAQAGVPIRFTVTAIGPTGTTLQYRFLYKAGYGTAAWEINPWVSGRDWSGNNVADISFPSSDNYIVVVQVRTSGTTWTTGDPQGGVCITVESQ